MIDDVQEQPMQVHQSPNDDGDIRQSLLAELGEIHKDVKAERHLDLDIPGYDGKLFARFRPYDIAQTERKVRAMQKKVNRHQPVLLAGACDTIIDACEQLFVRTADGRELPIDDVVPVKFEKRLAELLHFDNDTITEARHVILQLFPTQQSILRTSSDITEWLTSASRESDEDFLGESKGTTS